MSALTVYDFDGLEDPESQARIDEEIRRQREYERAELVAEFNDEYGPEEV